MNCKKFIFPIICMLLASTFVCLSVSAFYKLKPYTSVTEVSSLPTIVIDAGHGGEDGGAVNNDGVLEKNINLDISQDTVDLLKFLGFNVVATRTDDSALTTDGSTVHSRKVSDMKSRLKIFNSDTNNVVISIHQNKFPESKYCGTQVFYSPTTDNSKALAENIRYSVTSFLQPENTRECKKADGSIYLLKNAKVPAVIVECGFISNQAECSKLTDKNYQKQMSYAIVSGFLNYCNTNY